jgi:O-antigen/teichoic acid export membrane protein
VAIASHWGSARLRVAVLWNTSLFRNAYYLMSSSVLTSAIGYAFWVAAVRLFSQESIGLAGAVLSTTGLIVGIADFGLGVGLIRFLPSVGTGEARLLNSALTVTATASAILAALCLLFIPILAPQFSTVAQDPVFAGLFVLVTLVQSLAYTLGSVFMAKRASRFSYVQDTTSSIVKLLLVFPAAFVVADARGVVGATAVALTLAALYALFVLLPRAQAGFRLRPVVSLTALQPMMRYAFGNYCARIFLEAHILLVPLICLSLLGEKGSAVFYIAWASSMVFRVIPNAVFNSLFAEGANDPASFDANIRKAVKLTMSLLIPASILMLAGAYYFLLVIGREYASEGVNALRFLVLANIPWSINYLAISIARVRKDNKAVIAMAAGLFVSVVGALFLFAPIWHITGAGMAYAAGQVVVAFAVVGAYVMRRQRVSR